MDMDIGPPPNSLVAIMINLVIITTMIINMTVVMVINILIIILIIVIVVIIVGDQGPPISSQVTILTAFPTVGGSELLRIETMMMINSSSLEDARPLSMHQYTFEKFKGRETRWAVVSCCRWDSMNHED